jgi:hypothetical protein
MSTATIVPFQLPAVRTRPRRTPEQREERRRAAEYFGVSEWQIEGADLAEFREAQRLFPNEAPDARRRRFAAWNKAWADEWSELSASHQRKESEREAIEEELMADILAFSHKEYSKAAKSRSTLKTWEPSDLADFTPPTEFVEDWFRDGEFSSLFGPSTAGKTFLALHLAYHVATGRDWFGRRVRQRPVVYVTLEGAAGVINRVLALERHYGEPSPIILMTGALDMRKDKHTRADIIATAEKAGAGLIFIDTLARSMGDGDEDTAQDMGAFVRAVGEIQEACGAHVCAIHHTGKDKSKGARGSSALKAALDLEIFVDRPDSSQRTFAVTKNKNGEETEPQHFHLHDVAIDRLNSWGEAIGTAVVEISDFPDERTAEEKLPYDAAEALAVFKRIALAADVAGQMPTMGEWRDALRADGWNAGAKPDTWKKAFQRARAALIPVFIIQSEGNHVALAH